MVHAVGENQDRVRSFSDRIVMKKPGAKQFTVGAGGLVGREPFNPGAFYADIDVLSLDETADGQFTIKFRGDDQNKTYTAKSDPAAKGKWRLEKE